MGAVTINRTDKVPLFQRKLTVLPVITAADSRFELKLSIHKDDAVTSISCDGYCDVTIWVNTRSVNTFNDLFCPCEYMYIGFYSSRSVASNFTRLFMLNVIIFNVFM